MKNTKNTRSALGVMAQIKVACQRQNLPATLFGFLIGGIVPLGIFMTAHPKAFTAGGIESHSQLLLQWSLVLDLLPRLSTWLVGGGLVFSARTVFSWGRMAFENSAFKATGFVVLLEGLMVSGSTAWFTYTVLSYLVVINGVATGCTLALQKK